MNQQQADQSTTNPLTAASVAIAAAAAALGGGWILYSNLFIRHDLPLPDALPAARTLFYSQTAGQVNYYAEINGKEKRPLLLIHSINATASAYEVGPIFRHYRNQRPIYAIDLPGFGLSERSSRNYTPQMYEDAITDLVAQEIRQPVDAIALSLGGEFLARAAMTNPRLFHSITLISPSGMGQPYRASQQATANNRSSSLHRLLSFPLWGRPLFDLITTRRSIQFFLSKSFVGEVPAGLVEYGYLSSHQPGAEHAPLHFVSGRLFTRNVRQLVYEHVNVPALVIYDEDYFSRFDGLPELLTRKANWQAVRLTPSRGLPHFERMPELAEILNSFWQQSEKQAR